MHSQFGLNLRLALPRRLAGMLACAVVAPHMEQLEKAGEMAPIALAGEHRRPAVLVVFRANVAAAVARVEGVQPGACAEAAESTVEHHISSTKAVVDPALAVVWIPHTRTALERLRLEFGTRAEIGDQPRGIEARP